MNHHIRTHGGLLLWPLLVGACGGGGGGTALPSVSIGFTPAAVKINDEATLRWNSPQASSCTASGAWSGDKPASGSLTVRSTTAGLFTYTLTCTGADGSQSAAATLSVAARTAADYFQLEDTGLVIPNDNPDTQRTIHAIENLDLNGDGISDSVLVGPEFGANNNPPQFNRQSAHIVLGGATTASGASLFPAGKPTYVVSNHPISFDFNADGRRDLFLPEFGADVAPFSGGQSAAWLSGGGVLSPATLQSATTAMHGASAGRIASKAVVFAHAVCCGAEEIPFLYVNAGNQFTVDRSLLPALVTEASVDGIPTRVWTASAIADLDGDGFEDLALGVFAATRSSSTPSNNNHVVFGTATGWQSGAVLRLPDPQGIAMADFTALSLAVVDLDGDQRKDLVLSYTDRYKTRGIQILRNSGNRVFADVSADMLGAEAYVTGCPGSTLPAVDLNGDQCVDLVEPELVCATSGSSRGRLLISDCRGKFVNANGALGSVLSQLPDVSMLPFPDHTGRTSFYLPAPQAPSSGSGGLSATRYLKLRNLANLPTPADGKVRFD